MLYKSIINAVGIVAAVMLAGCDGNSGVDPNPNPTVTKGTFVDSRDGKTYKKVTINAQTWMAENLNYAEEGSKCYEDSLPNCETYGRLYNWATALTACPSGWHLPSDAEWTKLTDDVGGSSTAGMALKAKSGWNSYQGISGNGPDDYGFAALPGGYGNSSGSFYDADGSGSWWSATEVGAISAWCRNMYYNIQIVGRNAVGKTYLFSVRCVADQ